MVPKDMAQARRFFGDILGLAAMGSEIVPQQKVQVSFLDSCNKDAKTNLSSGRLELLEPLIDDSPIAKYLAKGGGIHHIALEVDNITAAIAHLKNHSVKMIDDEPKIGAHHTKTAFVHPHATGGFLVELVQTL